MRKSKLKIRVQRTERYNRLKSYPPLRNIFPRRATQHRQICKQQITQKWILNKH